jgi:hypothetical protein
MFLLVSCDHATKIEERSVEWPLHEPLSTCTNNYHHCICDFLLSTLLYLISLSFVRPPWWNRNSKHLSSYRHYLETATARYRTQSSKVQESRFLLLNCPNQLRKCFPTCRHHSLRGTVWPVVDIGTLRPRIFSRSISSSLSRNR